MGVTYAIRGPVVEVTGDGAYTTADVAAMLDAATRDPACPLPVLLLIDIRRSEITHMFRDVVARTALLQAMAPRVAFVAAGEAREHLAQVYRTRADLTGIRVEVFGDVDAAREWLLLPG